MIFLSVIIEALNFTLAFYLFLLLLLLFFFFFCLFALFYFSISTYSIKSLGAENESFSGKGSRGCKTAKDSYSCSSSLIQEFGYFEQRCEQGTVYGKKNMNGISFFFFFFF